MPERGGSGEATATVNTKSERTAERVSTAYIGSTQQGPSCSWCGIVAWGKHPLAVYAPCS